MPFLFKHLSTFKASRKLAVVLMLFLFLPAVCLASQFKADDSIFVSPHDTIDGNLYAFGSRLNIAGRVKGDLIFVGQDIDISGSVDGDIIGVGQNIKISGPVNGSVRLAVSGQAVIASSVARNLMAWAPRQLIIASSSTIGWGVLASGGQVLVRGRIGRSFSGRVGRAVVSGRVGRDVNLQLSAAANKPHLIIAPSAVIGGDLKYNDWRQGQISPQAKIKGRVIYAPPSAENKPFFSAYQVLKAIYVIFSVFVVGLVLVSLWRRPIIEITDLMLSRVSAAIAFGAGLMVLAPFLFLFLILTLIGLPLALILFGIWLLFIFLGKIMAAILLGRSLIEKFWPAKDYSLVWAMIIGVLVAWPLFSLPFFGWLLAWLASWWGLGGFYLYFKKAG